MPTESATRNNRAAQPTTHRAYQDHARYDAFGNVWQTYVSQVPSLRQNSESWYLLGGSTVNNRLANTTYDNMGNQTQLSVSAGTVASYDAENRMSKIAVGGSEVAGYTYDAEGRRVAKTAGGVTTYYFYDAAGQLMAEYGGPAQTAATQYFTTDYLGSTRMILNGTGGCLERLDYAPFGNQMTRSGYDCYGGASSEKPLFTGQMRDGESTAGTDTGQDYFNARYLWANIARFTSPDAPFADQRPEDGQSWNMYAYVRNNPLRYVDFMGRECVDGVSVNMENDEDNGKFCFVTDASSNREPHDYDAELSAYTWQFFREMDNRRNASNQMIGAVAGGSIVLGAGVGAAPVAGQIITQAAGRVAFGPAVGRVFWSGTGASFAALRWAQTHGGSTLEMTRIGRTLDSVTQVALRAGVPWNRIRPIWEPVSRSFAFGARDTAVYFQGVQVRTDSIWLTQELPTLQSTGVRIVQGGW